MAEKDKNNIEKSRNSDYNFDAYAGNLEAKKRWQERAAKGLHNEVVVPNDADEEDLKYITAYEEWIRDGKPVD